MRDLAAVKGPSIKGETYGQQFRAQVAFRLGDVCLHDAFVSAAGVGGQRAEPEKSGVSDEKSEAKPGCGCGGAQTKDTRKLCCYFPFAWTESYVTWYAEIFPGNGSATMRRRTIPRNRIRFVAMRGRETASTFQPGCRGQHRPYVVAEGWKTKGHRRPLPPGQDMTVLDSHFGYGQRNGDVRKLKVVLGAGGGNPAFVLAEVVEVVAKPKGALF